MMMMVVLVLVVLVVVVVIIIIFVCRKRFPHFPWDVPLDSSKLVAEKK